MKKKIEQYEMFHADKLSSEQQINVLRLILNGRLPAAREYLDNLQKEKSKVVKSKVNHDDLF